MTPAVDTPTHAVTETGIGTTDRHINTMAEKLEGEMAKKLNDLLEPFQDKPKPEASPKPPEEPTPKPEAAPKEPAAKPKPISLKETFDEPKEEKTIEPEPKPEEVPVAEKPPEAMSKAGKESWEKFRSIKNGQIEESKKALSAAEAKINSLTAELEKAKSGSGTPSEEVAALKEHAAKLEAIVERIRLEESPKFKNHYDGGIEREIKLAKAVAGTYSDEVAKLLSVQRSKEQNERLKEITSELGADGDIISNAATAITRLKLERQDQLSNHRQNLQLLREHEAAEAQKAQTLTKAQRQAQAERIMERVKQMPEFKADLKDTEHSQLADAAMDFIHRASMGDIDATDQSLLPVAAMKAHYLEKIKLPRLQAELDKLKSRLSAQTSAQPKIDGGQKTTAPSLPQRDADDPFGWKGPAKKFAELMGNT